jgi:hypothetical protein
VIGEVQRADGRASRPRWPPSHSGVRGRPEELQLPSLATTTPAHRPSPAPRAAEGRRRSLRRNRRLVDVCDGRAFFAQHQPRRSSLLRPTESRRRSPSPRAPNPREPPRRHPPRLSRRPESLRQTRSRGVTATTLSLDIQLSWDVFRRCSSSSGLGFAHAVALASVTRTTAWCKRRSSIEATVECSGRKRAPCVESASGWRGRGCGVRSWRRRNRKAAWVPARLGAPLLGSRDRARAAPDLPGGAAAWAAVVLVVEAHRGSTANTNGPPVVEAHLSPAVAAR